MTLINNHSKQSVKCLCVLMKEKGDSLCYGRCSPRKASSSLRYGSWCGAPSLQCQSSRERGPQPNSPLQPPFPPHCNLRLSPAVLLNTGAQERCLWHHYGKHSFGFQEWKLLLLNFAGISQFSIILKKIVLHVLSHTLNSQHPKVSNNIKHAILIQ